MWHYGAVVLLCTGVAGCAVNPSAPTGLQGAVGGLLGLVTAATALDQQLAEEFLKQNAELEFLSRRSQSCRDNDDPIARQIGVVTPKSIQKKERARIELRLKELALLKAYSDAIMAYVQGQIDRAKHVDDILSIGNSALSIGSFVPGVAQEAAGVLAAAKLFANAFKAIDINLTNIAIRDAAFKMRPSLKKMLANLKRSFHVVPDRVQLYLNAWRSCAEEKFVFMRDRPWPSLRSSVSEIDTLYAAFQSQYRQLINSVPQIGDALDKIEEANDLLINTSFQDLATTAQQLSTTVNSVIAAYGAVKGPSM